MDFSFDSNQLGVGNGIVSSISGKIKSYESDVKSELNSIVSNARSYKIDLSDTIKSNGIEGTFSELSSYLDGISSAARNVASSAQTYSNDPTGENLNLFTRSATAASNASGKISSKDVSTVTKRVLSTAGLGVFKFAEGGLEFFEDIGDCALVVGGGITSAVGDKKTSKKLFKEAAEKKSVNLIENNNAFNTLNRYSYADKNSVYANICKFGGKAAAAVATGKVASVVFKGLSSADAIAEASNVTSKASKVGKTVSSVGNYAGTFATKTTANLGQDHSVGSAMAWAAASAGADVVIDKVAPVVGSKVGSKVGEAAKDTMAEELFTNVNDSMSDDAKALSKKAIDYSVKEVKTKDSNMVKDKDKHSKKDAAAQDATNKTIDATKKTVESSGVTVLENFGGETVLKTGEEVAVDSLT